MASSFIVRVYQVFFCILLLAAALLVGGMLLSSNVLLPANKEVENLFLAQQNNKALQLMVWNLKQQKIVHERTVQPTDECYRNGGLYPASSSSESWGANNAVQYNPKTDNVFFLANTPEGPGAAPAAGCHAAIYKTALHGSAGFEVLHVFSDNEPQNWIANPWDNTLIALFVEDDAVLFQKIDAERGGVLLSKRIPASTGQSFAELTLSKDGKRVFLASEIRSDGMKTVHLSQINTSTLASHSQKIWQGTAPLLSTDVSPD